MTAREFTFQGEVVGYFEEHDVPTRDGKYRYMPYRGPGHYEMSREIKSRGSAVIEFEASSVMYNAVARLAEYGVLELSEFSRQASHPK